MPDQNNRKESRQTLSIPNQGNKPELLYLLRILYMPCSLMLGMSFQQNVLKGFLISEFNVGYVLLTKYFHFHFLFL